MDRAAAGALPILDPEHLTAQTFGDDALAHHVLELFEAQCDALAPTIAAAGAPARRAAALHTLRGAAQAVGARRLAAAITQLEAELAAGVSKHLAEEVLAAIRDARAASVQYRGVQG